MELLIRKWLWLSHNCTDTPILYGDDGEMQCNSCMIDFKRDSEDAIDKKLWIQSLKKAKQMEELKEQKDA